MTGHRGKNGNGSSSEEIDYQEADKKWSDCQKRLLEIRLYIGELTTRIVDCSPDDRPGLSAQRSAQLAEKELIEAELKILNDRRKTAFLRIYELALAKAKAEMLEINGERAELSDSTWKGEQDRRKALQEELTTIHTRKERDAAILACEMELATNRSRGKVIMLATQRARMAIYSAESALQTAQKDCSDW